MGQKHLDKNKQQPERTPQEDAQIQQVLDQYREIAGKLHKSRNEEQVGIALVDIFNLSENAQLGFLKALTKEHTTAAADVALAVNTYAPLKEVRKEARRALIRLESANTYPIWQIPTVMSLTDVLGTNMFEAADEGTEDALDSEDIIEHFLRHWGEGNFEAAYNLLATSSPLREGLSSEEWVARREAWAAEAQPARIQIDVGYGIETEIEDLPDGLDNDMEKLDAFWSLEMKDVPSSSDIPELPTATIMYASTGRHWFWTEYTFIEDENELRISSIRDKGAEALQLSEAQITDRIQDVAEEIQATAIDLEEDIDDFDDDDDDQDNDVTIVDADDNDVDDDDADEDENEDEDEDEDELDIFTEELVWLTKQSLHYYDAFIARVPENDSTYKLASQQAVIIHEIERAAAYVALAVERFPEQRGETLRSLGALCTHLAEDEDEDEYDENTDKVTNRFTILAEQAYRDAIAVDNTAGDHVRLAELLMGEQKLDEAEALLTQAGTLTAEPQELADVEVSQAQLARIQDTPEVALTHYQRAAELVPDLSGIWYNIGDIQFSLKQKEEATRSFLKSIEVDPTTTEAYADLATLYIEQGNDTAALEILEQGVEKNPFAADLLTAQAMLYISKGDLRKAEECIEEAEEIDPEIEIVQVVRQVINMQKEQQRRQQRSSGKHSNKSHKSKKRR